jgi:hypothetical protein
MIKIGFDPDELKRLENLVTDMADKIDHMKRVDLGAELSAWQIEDMHRNRPFTMRSRRAGRATTVVRPHSLYEMRASARYQRGMARRVARGTRKSMYWFQHWQARFSSRPILRTELFERLYTRMTDLLATKLRWKGY